MAIFWKHIKGLSEDAQTTTTDKTGLFSWLQWGKYSDYNKSAKNNYNCLPSIHIQEMNPVSDDTGFSFGHILVEDAMNQRLNNPIAIPRIILRTSSADIKQGLNTFILSHSSDGSLSSDFQGLIYKPISTSVESLQYQFITDRNLIFTKTGTLKANVGDVETENRTLSIEANTGTIKIGNSGHIDSPYFNATSDKRAKENIKPLSTNALDIINQIKVYTFNYKDTPDERTVGVIAQEFLDKKLDDVSLVANENAKGIHGDYMSIIETKLIYLLLKGLQEQQEEIQKLQCKINELESK